MKLYFWLVVLAFLVLLFFWRPHSRSPVNGTESQPSQSSAVLPLPPTAVKVGALPPFLQGERIFLFILILSHAKGRTNREAVRQTWLSDKPPDVAYKFFLGNVALQYEEIRRENEQHYDMVFLDVEDDYNSLSSKVRDAISWASSSYHFSFLLKTDDDTFVRIPQLVELLTPQQPKAFYFGHIWYNAPFTYYSGSQFYDEYMVADGFWRKCATYPDYASGAGYILSYDLTAWISNSRDLLRLFHNEDVTVGVWMLALNVRPINEPRIFVVGCHENFIMHHHWKPQKMIDNYNRWRTQGRFCERESDIEDL